MVKAITTYLRGCSGTSAIVKRPRCCNVLKRGYAADFDRWFGSNGSVDERGFASFENGAWVKIWRHKPPVALTARRGSRTRPLCPLPYPTPTSPCSGFLLWSCRLNLIRRTAVCGPACAVVREGRTSDRPPIPIQPAHAEAHLFCMIRKLQSGEYRLYSRKKDAKTGKRKNLGTFSSQAAAKKHERAVQYFKRAG